MTSSARARIDGLRVDHQVRCVVFHPKDKARRPAGQKGQPQEIQPRHLGDAAAMHWHSMRVERTDPQSAKIERKSGRSDDGGDSGIAQVKPQDGGGDAGRLRLNDASRRLLGQVEAFARHIGGARI